MSLLSGAVIALTLLGLANLLLLSAVLRRLREHQVRLDSLHADTSGDPEILAVGEHVGEFAAVGTRGEAIDRRDTLAQPTLVGFFSPACPPCHEQLPLFVEHGRDGARVLSVVLDDPEAAGERDEMVSRLEAHGPVVLVQQHDSLVSAFRVSAYPAVFAVSPDGRVESSGHAVAGLSGLLTA